MLYSRLWIERIHLVPKPTINILFYLLDCVSLTSTPIQTLKYSYNNADTLNIVVQREKKDADIDARMRNKPK